MIKWHYPMVDVRDADSKTFLVTPCVPGPRFVTTFGLWSSLEHEFGESSRENA